MEVRVGVCAEDVLGLDVAMRDLGDLMEMQHGRDHLRHGRGQRMRLCATCVLCVTCATTCVTCVTCVTGVTHACMQV